MPSNGEQEKMHGSNELIKKASFQKYAVRNMRSNQDKEKPLLVITFFIDVKILKL